MIFNSIEFLLFSLIFFSLWPFVRARETPRWLYIVGASFLFYGWWDWRFLFLILFTGTVNYFTGLLMPLFPKGKKLLLGIALAASLGSLFLFKYAVFFATVLQDFVGLFALKIDLISRIPEFALLLPVGISFFTFQALSYTIDIYRDQLKPTKSILHFFSYLAMFPQLVAGPIIRAKDFLKQLTTYSIPSDLQKWNAVKLICYGLFQKVVIADNLSYLIDSAYEGKTLYEGTAFWWLVTIAFSFQIYADFSGYSLMARGLAKYMGYYFKTNFNHPYLATSIRQFWSRWHISLSTWFRDYIYIPLGGSRGGILLGGLVLLLTMLLSGIWHGANYTFIAWAIIHSVFLLLERFTNWKWKLKLSTPILILIVFIQVNVAWVYFRSGSIDQANSILTYLFVYLPSDFTFFDTYLDQLLFLLLAILIEIILFIRMESSFIRRVYLRNQNTIDCILVSICMVMILFLRGEGKQFIYFQF